MPAVTCFAAATLVAILAVAAAAAEQPEPDAVMVDGDGATRPFPHFWEHIFGSGRAALTLRDSYRDDLRTMRRSTAISYVRFHAIFHDELGVYAEGPDGTPVYNFSYVDQVYDGLLAAGVRPFVELSFMPRALARSQLRHVFWYHPIVSPPKDYRRWDGLITAFARHLVERYGIEEVSQWYFEVWNEPNLDFWGGKPKQATYFELYDHTARALKAVDQRLRVGGPATAQAAWVADFIRHCTERHTPVDFISTHVYGDDSAHDVFGSHEVIPRREMVCRAVRKVHGQIKASALPSLPLLWSEFNATFRNERRITDAPFMNAWLPETVRQCDGLVEEMSYWTFSDVFEESGVFKEPLHGGFGLLAVGGVPKPAFNAFALLHQLGERRFAGDPDGSLVTLRSDGALVIALWNYRELAAAGVPRRVTLTFRNVAGRTASVQTLDAEHGNVNTAYAELGAPRYPTAQELKTLRSAASLPAPASRSIESGTLTVDIPVDGLALITVPKPAN
jgi:xylan 1,4-beta-xylosidase